jgi:hypothetical protein
VDGTRLSTGGQHASWESGSLPAVRAIEAEIEALPSTAAVLQRFAADVEARRVAPALPHPVQQAVEDYWRAWTTEAAALATKAQHAAAAVLTAADLYQQLETLLVPRALR